MRKLLNIIALIQNTIKDLSGGYYQVNPQALLYNGVDGSIINSNNNIVKFSGLKMELDYYLYNT